MKKLLAICIMALATPASARPWAAFYCGKLQVAMIPAKYFDPRSKPCAPCDGKTHYFDMKKDPHSKRPLPDRLFRANGDGDLLYKGKKCQEFDEDDYGALDTPGMSTREIARQHESTSKSQPSASIVIEFAPVPVAPGTIPPWNWTAERAAAESAAAERGRAAAEVAAREKSPVLTWKSQIVARLHEHKRYPEEAKSRRDQGVAQVFFSLDREGRVLESRVVRSSGANALDEEALALLRRAQPFPPPPQELAGDHVDLTVPIRFNLVQ
jgi:TonB family protein